MAENEVNMEIEINDSPQPDQVEKQNEVEEEKAEKLLKFPAARVKHIMKMDPDVNLAASDAIFLVSKATEFFVESLAAESYNYTANNKKKTLTKNDVDAAIDSSDCLAFLEGALED